MISSVLKSFSKPATNFARHFSASMPYKVYTWGVNSLKDNSNFSTPQLIFQTSLPIVSLSISSEHSAFCLEDGSMYIWGDNSNHQLGIEGTKFIDSPVMIDSLKGIPIEQVVCSQGYTAALTNDGAVLTWGDPAGQFGKKNVLGHKNKVIVPQPAVIDYFLDNNIKVNKIGGGVDFMNCISEYGDLYSWGDGSYGKLGNGSNSSERTPHNYKYNNELIGQIKDISTGFNATLALTTDNKIFSWGFDDQGQLGIPGQFSSEIKVTDLYPHLIYDKPEPIKKIAIGYGCGAYLTEEGKLTWWGMSNIFYSRLFQ